MLMHPCVGTGGVVGGIVAVLALAVSVLLIYRRRSTTDKVPVLL